MKTQHFVGAVAVACGVSSPAWAQSTVSLYGILDSGVTYTSNQSGSRNVGLQSGVSMPERWGMSGREDLGDGNFALFKLDSQIQTSNGKTIVPNGAFSLQSYVGLGGKWGALTLGRQYDFTGAVLPAYAVASNTTAGLLAWGLPSNAAAGGALDNRVWGIQVNNAVKYVSPSLGGFSFGAMWGFGNVPGSIVQSSSASYLISYENGSFSASIVYYGQRDVATGGNLREFAGGAAYNLGDVRLFGMMSDVRINAGASPRATTYETGLTWSVTPAVQLGGGVQYQTRNNGIGAGSQLTLSADYFFSKRTDLYLVFALAHDKGYGAQVEAALGGSSTGSMQNAVRVGLRHMF